MKYLIEIILEKIALKNPAHAEKLRSNMQGLEKDLFPDSELFYCKYEQYLEQNGLSLDFAVDCYLRMYSDMLEERWKFKKTGLYSNTSFKEVDKKIYSNKDIMTYHMNGLVLGQFLWFDQYERFKFFKSTINQLVSTPKKYLEIGGGHGLYMMEALKQLPPDCQFELIDISPSSIELSKGIINDPKVNYVLNNIFDLDDTELVDFFTMGEVLEHLEEPEFILKKLSRLIKNNGKGYITTPINSAMIDHIYLFKDVEEIRNLFDAAGLQIIKEKIVISEHISYEQAMKLKVPIMYAAFVESKK